MRVLVTGSDGYIGVVLVSTLMGYGYDVVGLDTGFYRDGWLDGHPHVNRRPSIAKDIRHLVKDDLKGFEAVVHLAELSNDPLGELNPSITHDINHRGTVRLAELCKAVKIPRFVYTSSCSVYGVGCDSFMTEQSELHPQTAYAECKVLVEKDVSALGDGDFSPSFLRNATAYGPSPRMRFDIVLNNLAGLAWTTQKIAMTSDGTPWRPLVHVSDICDAVACTLAAPRETIHNQIFNVGDNKENYQVRDIAEIVARAFPQCSLTFGPPSPDNRSYRVSFDKIATKLPGFRCRRNAFEGAVELREIFARGELTREIFEFRAFTRVKQLRHLLSTHHIDDHLFWV